MRLNIMKRFLLLLIVLIGIISCSKVNKNATIIKDCTGSYIRFADKDYHICNGDKVDGLDSGTKVMVSFKKISSCSEGFFIVCRLYHENEGWVKITMLKL